MRTLRNLVLVLAFLTVVAPAAGAQGPAVTLQFAYWGDQEYHQAIVGALEAFQEEYPSIRVEPLYVTGITFTDAILTRLAGGIMPDVMDMSVELFPLLMDNRALLDLGPFIDRDSELDRETWLPGVLEMFSDGERVYALPRSPNVYVLWYNANAFDEAGIGRPQEGMDWAGYVDAARRLTVRRSEDVVDRWGASPYSWISAVFENGGRVIGESGFELRSEAALEALRWVADHGLQSRFAPTPGMRVPATAFLEGRFAMSAQGSWRLAAHLAIDSFEWSATGLPIQKAAAAEGSIDMGVIAAQTQHPDEAWLLLKYLNVKGERVATIFESYGKLKPPLTRDPGVHGEIWAGEPRADVKRLITAESAHIVDPFHGLVKAAELRSAINPVINQILDGTVSAEAGIERLNPVIDGILR